MRPLTSVTGFCSSFLDWLKNLTNVVIGKLGKLVHKQTLFSCRFYYINENIIIVQVRYITIETKEVARIRFLFPHSYQRDHAREETRYTQYWPIFLLK